MSAQPEGDEGQANGERLPGTVKLYERHLYVCTGRADWAAHVEEDDAYLAELAAALGRAQAASGVRIKLSACDAPTHSPAGIGPAYDLLVFPEGRRYPAVTPADFPALIDHVLKRDDHPPELAAERLSGWQLFVCVHARRDGRCGLWGPQLVDRFGRELAARRLEEVVHVYRSSHVGGHRFAGNVIVYPGGDWYGYVRPDDVPELVDRHIRGGYLLRRLWRGRMGLTPDEQTALAAGWADVGAA